MTSKKNIADIAIAIGLCLLVAMVIFVACIWFATEIGFLPEDFATCKPILTHDGYTTQYSSFRVGNVVVNRPHIISNGK